MKPKLPKALFVALLAACANVGYAETSTVTEAGYKVIDDICYVQGKPDSALYTGQDGHYVYVLSPGKNVKVSEVIHVGNHDFENVSGKVSGPALVAEANAASGYVVTEGGILAITGAETAGNLTAGEVLTSTTGNGDIILRAPGYEYNELHQPPFEVKIKGTSQCSGNLYLSPKIIPNSTNLVDSIQNYDCCSLQVFLEDGANISSFNSINLGVSTDELAINGKLGNDQNGNHLNNVTFLGSYSTLHINTSANDAGIVLGGTTTVASYHYAPEFGDEADYGAMVTLNFNQNATLKIEHLTSNVAGASQASDMLEYLYLTTGYTNATEIATNIAAVVDIDSFDYRGNIIFWGLQDGSIKLSITLKNENGVEQWLSSSQYAQFYSISTDSLTLKGSGRYILEEGNDILVNFGRLSTQKDADDNHLWQGTVQIDNLDATESGTGQGIDFAYYGNEQSHVDIRGFKGDVEQWDINQEVTPKTDETAVTIAPNLILTNTDKMSAYEVTGGADIQNYTGSISGEGDFVVSSAGSHQINYSGDLSGWQGDMKVTQGNHQVNFGGDATVVNADILREGGTLAVTVGAPNAEKAVVFHGDMKVDSLTTYAGTSAEFTQDAAKPQAIREIGAYQFSNHAESMKIAQGVSIAGTAITGLADVVGQISNAQIQTGAGDTYSIENVHLTNSAITAACDRVTFKDVSANGLYLSADGNGTVYESLDQQGTFKYNAATQTVEFSSSSFSGMVLEALTDNSAVVKLTVKNTVEQWQETVGDMVAHVKITLEGFSIENQTAGIVYADPSFLQIQTDGVSASGLAVSDMLEQEFDSVYYFQNGANLEIHMMLSIPEPATATMSLLALAAMAARRRRR